MTDERHQREKKPHDIRHPAHEPGVQDSTEPPGTRPGDRIAELEAELAVAREEAKDAKERWLRERADVENLKKRTARERADAVRFGTESLVRDLLPVVDNLERAVQAARGGGDGSPLVEGVALVLKALHDVLEPPRRHPGGGRGHAASTPPTTRPWPTSRAPSTRPTPSSRSTSPAIGCTTGCCGRRW